MSCSILPSLQNPMIFSLLSTRLRKSANPQNREAAAQSRSAFLFEKCPKLLLNDQTIF